jgi:hypothetical protein
MGLLAHRQGSRLVAERGMVSVSVRADIVVASAGGFPKDINLYQAHKGLDNAAYFAYPLKTSFDRKRGRKDGKTTTLEPKNGFQKR